jgi:cysteinylglycine-S-conjugate dipeptidase
MSASTLPPSRNSTVRDLIRAGAPSLIADLASLVMIPSVSWDGFDQAHVEASATAVADLFAGTGLFESVAIYRHGGGAPALIARREPRAGRPTVVLYAHHDVQPPGNVDDWVSDPYQPVVRGGRLYGRGSADDKAGIAVHLGALRVLSERVGEALDLGIVVFIEGEEENGSPSFENFLAENYSALIGDIIVVADSDNPAPHIPALTTSLRGNVTATLTLQTLKNAVHSGMFGGVLPDAMTAFVMLAASFYSPDGSLAIEGLESSFAGDDAGLVHHEAWPLRDGVKEIGSGSVSQRLWRSPALTITGIDAPSVAHASNTLLPSVTAKISLRVAPGQSASSARDALARHVEAHTPFGAHSELSEVSLGEPFLMDSNSPALSLASRALETGFGHPTVFQGVGGSIPFISHLATRFPKAQIVVTGVEDPLTQAHSPNESLHLGVLWRAVHAETIFLEELNAREVSGFLHDVDVH